MKSGTQSPQRALRAAQRTQSAPWTVRPSRGHRVGARPPSPPGRRAGPRPHPRRDAAIGLRPTALASSSTAPLVLRGLRVLRVPAFSGADDSYPNWNGLRSGEFRGRHQDAKKCVFQAGTVGWIRRALGPCGSKPLRGLVVHLFLSRHVAIQRHGLCVRRAAPSAISAFRFSSRPEAPITALANGW